MLARKRFGVSEIAVLGAAVTDLVTAGQLAWVVYAPGSDASGAALLHRIVATYQSSSAYVISLILGPALLSVCLLMFLWWRRRQGAGRHVVWSPVPLLLTLGFVAINVALIQGPGLIVLSIPLLLVPVIMEALERARSKLSGARGPQ